ncbi:MAG TPA: FliH/SctL family protein [Haliangiales bacterium]|nr:FliH/SctL family protein [Haliangiales bacterium]
MRQLFEVLKRVDGNAAPEWLSAREAAPPRPLFAAPAPVKPDPTEVARQIEEARAEAELEGLKAAQDKVETVIERYMDGIDHLAEVARAARRPVAEEVVALAMVVARAILERELTLDRDLVIETVDRALRAVEGEAAVTVRLGRADLAYVRQRRPELMRAGVAFVEDNGLGVGGCIVESADTVTEATMDARLQSVARALVEVMRAEPETPAAEEERAAC